MTEKIKSQIQEGIYRRDEKFLQKIFDLNKDSVTRKLKKECFIPVLEKLGVLLGREEIEELFLNFDMNNDGLLDFAEFKRATSFSSNLEQLICGFPVSQMIADAMPRQQGKDPIRLFSEITPAYVKDVCSAILPFLENLLIDQASELKESFKILDNAKSNVGSSKFQAELVEMCVGGIDDFHAGLSKRIGLFFIKRSFC